jgi:hypothetical protein
MSENLGRTYRKTVRPSLGGHPGFHPRIERRDGLLIEWDRAVAIRGGLTPYAGVYRPAGAVRRCWSGHWSSRDETADIPDVQEQGGAVAGRNLAAEGEVSRGQRGCMSGTACASSGMSRLPIGSGRWSRRHRRIPYHLGPLMAAIRSSSPRLISRARACWLRRATNSCGMRLSICERVPAAAPHLLRAPTEP